MKTFTQKHKYAFKPAKSNFKALYKIEERRLRSFLPKSAKIEHIGSTAIPGLGGKGIIDIALAAQKKDIQKIKKKLENKGYKHILSGGDKERIFLQKDYKSKGKVRRIHIQLTFHNSNTWRNAIALRDYLIKHKEAAEQYAQIKKKGAKIAKGKGKLYRKHKDAFIKRITKLALKEQKHE